MDAEDRPIEQLLLKYRVLAAPPPQERIVVPERSTRQWWKAIGWGAVAAGLLVSLGLHWASMRMGRQIGVLLESDERARSAEVDQVVRVLDGEELSRTYLALRLAAGYGAKEARSSSSATGMYAGEM